jgi:predicted RNase H-like HicB family nuclease
MRYRVVLIESDEGYAASCPQLRGCHSQGATVEEALENIKEAIRDWLAVQAEQRPRPNVIEAEVSV